MDLAVRPVSRLRHGPSDVGSAFGRTGIAGEIVVFEGTLDPVLAHAGGIRGDTEGDVRSGGSTIIPDGCPETFESHIRPRSLAGRKRTLQALCFPLLLPCLVQRRDLLLEGLCHGVLLTGVTAQTNEREEAVQPLVPGFAVGETGQPAQASPVGRTRIGVVACGLSLGSESA